MRKQRDIKHLNPNQGRKLIFRFATGGPCSHQFWVNRRLMMHRSKVIREACEKNPKKLEFNDNDVLGFANIFQSVIQFVHDDVVPIGRGGVVGWFSQEAQTYVSNMLRLYRFAEKYQMEDLADRTLDELQAHEHRCGGKLFMSQITEAYEGSRSHPDSKMRWYCAMGLYRWLMTTKPAVSNRPACCAFKALMELYPEVVEDIYRAEDAYDLKGPMDKVDYRDQKTFGTCEFHIHKRGGLCYAANPEVAELRSWGDAPSTLRVPIQDRYWDDEETSEEMDNTGPAAEEMVASAGLGDAGKAAVETIAQYTSPGFEDSGLGEGMGVAPNVSGSAVASKAHPKGHVEGYKRRNHKESPLSSPDSSSGHENWLQGNMWEIYPLTKTHTELKHFLSPSSKKKKSRKVIQSSPQPKTCEVIRCRACDQEFPRKQDLLEHLAGKKGDRKHRMGGRSFNLSPDGEFVSVPTKRVRFDL